MRQGPSKGLTNVALARLHPEVCLVYLDDIIVFGEDRLATRVTA